MTTLLRTHTFFTLGLVAHITALLFISLYAMLTSSGEINGPSALETNDAVLSSISVLTIIVLYISFAMELTWPMRVEETLIIILLWSLLSNVGSGLLFDAQCQPQYHHAGFSADGMPSAQQPPPPPGTAGSHTTVQSLRVTADESPGDDIDVDTDDESVIIVKPHSGVGGESDPIHANSHPNNHHHGTHANCGNWAMFDIWFSLLCVFSSLLSLLCDTKNYYLSVLFKTLSVCITVLIFLVPIRCNRFRLMSIEVLILKITLYNIVWNMNRFKRITETLIGKNYMTGVALVKRYQTMYSRIDTAPSPQQQRTTMPVRRPASQQHHDYSDSESDYDYASQKRRRTVSTPSPQLYADDTNMAVPVALFALVDTVQYELDPVRRRLHKRAREAEQRHQPHLAAPLISPQERAISEQLANFETLAETNRRYNTAWFASWKNRYYGERIVYLFDIASTIWILAICPIYLFTVVILLFWLAYYIRINMRELEDTSRTVADMTQLRTATTTTTTTSNSNTGDNNGYDDGYRDSQVQYRTQPVHRRDGYYDG